MAHTASKSFVQSLAVAVIGGGVLTLTKGQPVAGGLAILVGFSITYGYQYIHDEDLRHAAENAAKNVSAEDVISGTQELSDDAKSTLQGWLNQGDST